MSSRRARASDEEAIAGLVYGEPSSDGVAILGSAQRSVVFGKALMSCCPELSWRHSVVFELDGEVVAVIQDRDSDVRVRTLSLFRRVIPRLGLAVIRAPRGGRALQRVRLATPPDAWVVRELYVRADLRGQGIGGTLLRGADDRARAGNARRIALTTRTNNPARRLYERHGYRIIREQCDAAYEQITGARGRVLME